jgi:subtilase family serine protease
MRFIVAATLTFLVTSPLLLRGQSAAPVHRVSPLLVVGPKAIPVNAPGAVIFSCQLPGSALNCYSPSEILNAYNIQPLHNAGITGAGKTIVIIDAFGDPTIQDDLNVFDEVFGLPSAKLNIIYPDGKPTFDPTNGDEVGWSGEIALDVEYSHVIAPAATIDLVIAKSDQDADILSAQRYAVAHHLGDVVSQSFGENESCMDPSILRQTHQVFIEATLKDMTLFASSADDGAALPTCDGNSWVKAVSTPAVDPLVTGVGGTSLTATQPTGTYVGETVWNDEFGASGGGYSVLFNKPLYQLLTVRGSKRGVPDVAYNGDVNNGVLVSWSQGVPANVGEFWIFGGTSAGSPQWAGLVALADQRAGYDLGFINQGLYLMGLDPFVYFGSFHDITIGNNSVVIPDSAGNPVSITGYNARPGWDPTTGLGSPKGIYFVDNLLSFVSPSDGLAVIAESGPLSGSSIPLFGKQRPH